LDFLHWSLFNRVWLKSFARRDKNRKAIRDRGWYPANQALLLDEEILKTRTLQTPTPSESEVIVTASSHESLELSTDLLATNPTRSTAIVTASSDQLSEIPTDTITTASGFTSNSQSTIDTLVVPSPWIDLNNINFDCGLAGEFMVAFYSKPIIFC